MVVLRNLHVSCTSSRNWFDVSFNRGFNVLNLYLFTTFKFIQSKLKYRFLSFYFRNTIHSYDPFECHKQNDFINSISSIDLLINLYIKDIICNKEYNIENSKNDFLKFLKLSLWGNR